MKKIIFTIVWIIVFFVFHVIIWSVGVALWAHPSQAMSWSDQKTDLIMLLDRVGFYGFPSLALVLGIFGKLPGTRSKKQFVQT